MGKLPLGLKQELSGQREWMEAWGIKTLFDLSIWDELDKDRWVGKSFQD